MRRVVVAVLLAALAAALLLALAIGPFPLRVADISNSSRACSVLPTAP